MNVRPSAPASSAEVRDRLVEALRLDVVGPWPGHVFAEERLPGWIRPSTLVPDRLPHPLGHASREDRRRG